MLGSRAGATPEPRVPSGNPDNEFALQDMNPVPTTPNRSAVFIDQITLRLSPSAEPVLHGFSLDVKLATTILVVGPVGCGKTVLMKAILGEFGCESGDIFVYSKSMAYCSQTPWLLNSTIRQSICGLAVSAAIDEEWYKQVIFACALDRDIFQLPDGDQSVIGSRGLTLSGGQKQRLVSDFT